MAAIPDPIKSQLISMLPRLRRFAITLTGSGPDADDLLQEACTAVFERWSQYDTSKPFDRWMFQIVRNTWISEVRKRKVRQGQGQVDAEDATELTVQNSGADNVEMSDALAMIHGLGEDLSQPLLLVCSEGYSYQEVADLLEIPKGTVMSRIHRARKMLAEQMSHEGGAV